MQPAVASAPPMRGTELVAPDVLRLRILFVNVYLIGTPGEPWVLVDAGVRRGGARIVRAAEERFGTGARPQAIILTHGHFDHVGALGALAALWDVPVYAHARELPFLTGQQWYPPADPLAAEGLMGWLAPVYPRRPITLREQVQPMPADGGVPCLPGWEALATPGHTPGHISLFRSDDRLLVAGDAVVTTRQEAALAVLTQVPVVRRPPAYFTPDWPAARRSVEQIAALGPAVIASGHGPAMRGPKLERQLAELAGRFDEVGLPKRGRYVAGMSGDRRVKRKAPGREA